MHASIYECVPVSVSVRAYASECVCVSGSMCIYMNVCACLCIYESVCVSIGACTYRRMRMLCECGGICVRMCESVHDREFVSVYMCECI